MLTPLPVSQLRTLTKPPDHQYVIRAHLGLSGTLMTSGPMDAEAAVKAARELAPFAHDLWVHLCQVDDPYVQSGDGDGLLVIFSAPFAGCSLDRVTCDVISARPGDLQMAMHTYSSMHT